MNGTQLAIKFALSPTGARVDRFCVKYFGHSPVVFIFTRSDQAAYNRPLLLTTTGRKTGRARPVVLPYFELRDRGTAIVASRGGMPSDPQWAHNLRVHPEVTVHIDRRARRARAREVVDDERERLWPELVERSPVYARYQAAALEHRKIPVFLIDFAD